VKQDLAAETEARKTAIRDAQAALTAETDQVRALSRQVAVGGLRLQAVGWAFLFSGSSLVRSATRSAGRSATEPPLCGP
jgi:hypothetical protein